MTTMLMEVEIYVEDTGLFRALTIEGDDVYVTIFLGKDQSYEVADRMEAIAEGRCREPFEVDDGQDSLTIEEYEWMKVRINLNRVRGILDRFGVREIAHDLRAGWEAVE
ncbi:MAG: hypothetical protein IKP53_08475 [Candidatus Methanomethylophilaceae archaeon]|nr:hypothetical protein [Candidatus Methanomethylophilaceae archaeon]